MPPVTFDLSKTSPISGVRYPRARVSRQDLSDSDSQNEREKMNGEQSVIKVFLMNGESRSLRLDERMDVTVSGAGERERETEV